MTAAFLSSLLGVMLLLDPREILDAEAAAVSRDADHAEFAFRAKASGPSRKSARIRSVSSDFDRKAGVILFDGNVVVEYESDYTLCADRVFAFLASSNRLSRIVAVGDVVISNGTRVGTCALATYRKAKGEIEMFGEKGTRAHLVERGENASELAGDRIRFWLDSEQAEVENSALSAEHDVKEGGL